MENNHQFLFEISWEVCNLVGGINTVLRTKVPQVKKHFDSHYILIGPLLETNDHFVESISPCLSSISKVLSENNVIFRCGYWDIEDKPMVILIDYRNRYSVNDLLFSLWSDFGVDSYQSSYDYIEPVLFSTLAGEVIHLLHEKLLGAEEQLIAHFHEWLSGAGVLYLNKHAKYIPTIFTIHATVLGRALSEKQINLYHLTEAFNPEQAARENNVISKHSLERAAAKNADCFTAVSTIVADEAYLMLGIYPDKILFNGLNVDAIQLNCASLDKKAIRRKLLAIANKTLNTSLPENTLLWLSSGRFELHNKGYDIILKSLAKLNDQTIGNFPNIVFFLLIAKRKNRRKDDLLNIDQNKLDGILTHPLIDPYNDSVFQLCRSLGFNNIHHKISVIYSDVYLEGIDGVFDLPYHDILASCDLGLFPSFYEPWGYTALECLASEVPTITSDLTGFGAWISGLVNIEACSDAVFVLEYKNKDEQTVVDALAEHLSSVAIKNINTKCSNENAIAISKLAGWKILYSNYLEAYSQAIEYDKARFHPSLNATDTTVISGSKITEPHFHKIQHEISLPESLVDLKKLSNNYWWSWNKNAEELFAEIDELLWNEVYHNPVRFLLEVSEEKIFEKSKDRKYLLKLNQISKAFNYYLSRRNSPHDFYNNTFISSQCPIAFFSLEYGIHESLPIYSGGLGILSGDYLKTASDLNLPLIAVGLFYKEGYFDQTINSALEQETHFHSQDPNNLPMKLLCNDKEEPIVITLKLADKTLRVKVWQVAVGTINLYLLDTDLPENSSQDRQITRKLYVGEKETRLLQELVLGIGGIRLISDILNLKPAIYHLNEGHSAFLLLEQLSNFIQKGFSFSEAIEATRNITLFTTHTSVSAGHEIYPDLMIKKYLSEYAEQRGVPFSEILHLGIGHDHSTSQFSLTSFAFNLSLGVNAVSQIHRQVVCSEWSKIWPGFLEVESPIQSITNGIHIPSWIGDEVQKLLQKKMKSHYLDHQTDINFFEEIKTINNTELWNAHQRQKLFLIKEVKELIVKEYTDRNEPQTLINQSVNALDPNTLIIGFARRFASYKRHDLIFRNPSRLASLINQQKKPVVLIIAGKAHPSDPAGKKLIHDIVFLLKQIEFQGRIIFLENYDMALAKPLVQGVDLWLNTPFLLSEACGTSGMKAGINGALNCSIKDGWWYEAHDESLGWSVKSFSETTNPEKRSELENNFLLDLLENSIIPTFYKKNKSGFSADWVAMMKSAISTLIPHFSSQRMLKNYFEQLYFPITKYSLQLMNNNAENLISLVQWKNQIINRFKTMEIKTLIVNGIKNGKLSSEGVIGVKLVLFSGKLSASEIKVELVLVKNGVNQSAQKLFVFPLKLSEKRNSGLLIYDVECNAKEVNFDAFSVRIYPFNPLLYYPQEAKIACWE